MRYAKKSRKTRHLVKTKRGYGALTPRKFRKRLGGPRIVVCRPNFEQATQWGAYWFGALTLQAAIDAGLDVKDLYQNDAHKAMFDGAVSGDPHTFVTGIGHGNETTFTGQDYDELLVSGRQNDAALMAGKSGSFLSCVFGQAGDYFTQQGMKAFFGYIETFYFMAQDYPNAAATPFFKSHCAFDLAILAGKSFSEAFIASRAAWNDAIAGSPETNARYMIWDRDAMILWGDGAYRPYGDTQPPEGKLYCPWGDYETTDMENLKGHILAAHCPTGPTRPLWCRWFGNLVGCPIP